MFTVNKIAFFPVRRGNGCGFYIGFFIANNSGKFFDKIESNQTYTYQYKYTPAISIFLFVFGYNFVCLSAFILDNPKTIF